MAPLRAVADDRFVAGHPLAGSAARGIAAARADLFEGATWFIDRDDATVREIIAACGANAEIVDAAEHDRAVALTSHLPQILSTALAAYLHDQNIDLRFAGPGLRTFLRLAGSEASVWTPILDANRENLRPHVDAIAEIVRAIVEGDASAVRESERPLRETAGVEQACLHQQRHEMTHKEIAASCPFVSRCR